jgi:uncharacterized membrane protein
MKLTIFGREPALWISVLSGACSLAVSLGIGLDAEEAAAWVAVITALFGAATAVATRPIAPAAFTTLVTVTADLLAAYHYDVSAGTVAAVNGFVLAGLTLLTRAQVSPKGAEA